MVIYPELLQDFDVVLTLDDALSLDEARLSVLVQGVPLQGLGQPQLLSTQLVQDVASADHQNVLVQVGVQHHGEVFLIQKSRHVIVSGFGRTFTAAGFVSRCVGQLRVPYE